MEKAAVGAVTMIFLVILLLCALVYEVRENSAKARELKDLRANLDKLRAKLAEETSRD